MRAFLTGDPFTTTITNHLLLLLFLSITFTTYDPPFYLPQSAGLAYLSSTYLSGCLLLVFQG